MHFPTLHQVKPGSEVLLAALDPADVSHFPGPEEHHKKDAGARVKENVHAMAGLQERLFAENKQALLIVLQGMDTSGKDGVVRHVFSGLNPQGCHVTSFKKPSEAEADRDYLWRIHANIPPRGEIGVFNRAHYEDVLIVRVHDLVPEKIWSARYHQINEFESYLTACHVVILKFFLHISKDEQKQRLQDRLDDPSKHWKFASQDLAERKLWPKYIKAYEVALAKCSTEAAPWYAIPSDKKWYRNWAISQIVRETLEKMNPQYPHVKIDAKLE